MANKKYIAKDKILALIPRLEKRELTQIQAAKELGVSVEVFKDRAAGYGIKLPRKRHEDPLSKRLLKLYTKEELLSKSGYEIARELRIKQSGVCKALKELGLSRNHHQAQRDETAAKCQTVIEYLEENGGSVAHAVQALGHHKEFRLAVYKFARDNNIDLRQFRMAYQKYGHWTVLPCIPEPCSTQDYRVDARCELCGTVHRVTIVNLRSGGSTKCRACADKDRNRKGYLRVRNVQTGKVYPSIRSWATEIGQSKRYQQLRVKLKRNNSVEIDGCKYVLV